MLNHTTDLMTIVRMDLLKEYCALYKERNTTNNKVFRDNYTRLSEIWMELNPAERKALNTRLFQTQ